MTTLEQATEPREGGGGLGRGGWYLTLEDKGEMGAGREGRVDHISRMMAR